MIQITSQPVEAPYRIIDDAKEIKFGVTVIRVLTLERTAVLLNRMRGRQVPHVAIEQQD
jgi:hypothetical protein